MSPNTHQDDRGSNEINATGISADNHIFLSLRLLLSIFQTPIKVDFEQDRLNQTASNLR